MDTLLNKAEISMEDLRMYLQEHDFSAMVSDYDLNSRSSKDNALHRKVRKIISAFWDDQMKVITGKRMRNFSRDSAAGCLKEKESALIAGSVMKVKENEALYKALIHAFFETWHDEMEAAREEYALANNKTPEELTLEDCFAAWRPFFDTIAAYVINLLLRGQNVEEIAKLTDEMGAHEDFSSTVENFDRSNFERKWYHTRSKVGKLLSLEETKAADNYGADSINMVAETINQDLPYADTSEEGYLELLKAFLQQIEDPVDRKIVELRSEGKTLKEIAGEVGVSYSAVSKRLGKLRKRYNEIYE